MKNYYVYIPIAYLFTKYKETFVNYRAFFLCGFILAVLFEELYQANFLSAYARLSVLLGATYLISEIHAHEFDRVKAIEWLSKYSLGIFALHLFCQKLFLFLFDIFRHRPLELTLLPSVERVLIFSLSVALTLISVFVLSKTKLKIYVG